ncbi:NTP transferase domain-containing protein [Lewinella sp. 4G2]|uniref:nucleotidyltransferase family protein n=1 Tax=Lewinella sp. 4G2 TaxID=1803372 RepID=UPI0007DF359A|nr:nucleotidyltransferase family protein [Lewinella sp. 4G2]OAV46093.1 hypothetical protein A3850_017675 [Lewinella sp. 4G2]
MADAFTARIILAAGASRRMGQPKQLLELSGQTLLERIVRASLSLPGPTVIVTGHYHDEIVSELSSFVGRLAIVRNPDPDRGMSSSIATGMRSIDLEVVDGYFILLTDQPEINSLVLQRMAQTYQDRTEPRHILATAYPEGPGVPAIFPVAYREALLNETGQGGARKLLRNQETDLVMFDLGFVPIDLDTYAEFEQFRDQLKDDQ